MSGAELRLTYKPEDDWHGELHAAVSSDAFSGKGACWLSLAELKEKVLPALRQYPITNATAPMVEGGFWGAQAGVLDQCHLRIRVKPQGLRGALLVQLDLATPAHQSPDENVQHSMTARFLTEYAAIERFADELEQLLAGACEAVTLTGRLS